MYFFIFKNDLSAAEETDRQLRSLEYFIPEFIKHGEHATDSAQANAKRETKAAAPGGLFRDVSELRECVILSKDLLGH